MPSVDKEILSEEKRQISIMIKIDKCGLVSYFRNILRHRANGLPATVNAAGSKWYYENGKWHRANDLPAIEHADGSRWYWENGNYLGNVDKDSKS